MTSRASSDSDAGFTRREFGVLLGGALVAAPVQIGAQARTAVPDGPGGILDIAEWSYFWFGVEHVTLARGTVCNGRQMYVEHWIPSRVRHPYPVVLIHGGYGAGHGLDQHTRWPPRLGVATPRTGLQGLCGGPARPGPQSLSSVGARKLRCSGADVRTRQEHRLGNDAATPHAVAREPGQ